MTRRSTARFCSKACACSASHAAGVFDASKSRKGAERYNYKPTLTEYKSIHARISRERGSAQSCVLRPLVGCSSGKYEWSHIHGTDPSDIMNYRQMCKSCHITYDGQRGEGHTRAALTQAQADEIRARYAAGGVSQQSLADDFGVSQHTVSRLLAGSAYATVGV